MFGYYLLDRVRDERRDAVVEMRFGVLETGFPDRGEAIGAAVSRAVEIGRISGYTPLFRVLDYTGTNPAGFMVMGI